MRYKSLWNDVMSEYSPSITVKNHTKGSVWTRKPAPHNIRLYHEQHLWQGHISNEGFLLETGDQVEVDVDFGDHVTILETGVSLVYKSNGSYPEYEAASSNTNAASTDDEGSVDENDDEQLAYSTDEAASNNYDAVSINEDFVYEIEDELSTHSQDEAAPNNSGFVSVDDVSIAEIEDEPPTHAEDEAESVETETTGEFDGVNPPADCQDIPRYQGSPQLPTGENHHRPHRKMSFGLRALLGAFGFLALIVALGKYGQPLRRFPAIREKKGGKKTEQNE
ncbi:PREDICTED: uncharacterized protein LOC104824635 [Tarenaya hassleriana]|uniref:uncharacterized protein LOC104824635 n=1 Tax=Tarenaya hassleriana TaxID=28532 RepID=UPI00053C14A5|nr:PREDICTED: uncharacterized protein LOC104824635 [Tarenaya hassleriana]